MYAYCMTHDQSFLVSANHLFPLLPTSGRVPTTPSTSLCGRPLGTCLQRRPLFGMQSLLPNSPKIARLEQRLTILAVELLGYLEEPTKNVPRASSFVQASQAIRLCESGFVDRRRFGPPIVTPYCNPWSSATFLRAHPKP